MRQIELDSSQICEHKFAVVNVYGVCTNVCRFLPCLVRQIQLDSSRTCEHKTVVVCVCVVSKNKKAVLVTVYAACKHVCLFQPYTARHIEVDLSRTCEHKCCTSPLSHLLALEPRCASKTSVWFMYCKHVDYVIEIKSLNTHCIFCYDPRPLHDVGSFPQRYGQRARMATFGRKSLVAGIPLGQTADHRIIHFWGQVGRLCQAQ